MRESNSECVEDCGEGGVECNTKQATPPFATPRSSSSARICVKTPWVLGGAFLLCAILVPLFLLVGPLLAKYRIALLLPLRDPTSAIFRPWQDTWTEHVELKRNYYFFNVTNPVAVVENHTLPDLVRVGPFVFYERQYNPMDSILWAANGTVGHTYIQDFEFAPELSIDANTGMHLSLDMEFTSLNLPLFAVGYRLSRMPDFNISLGPFGNVGKRTACQMVAEDGGNEALGRNGIFHRRTFREYMAGFKDDIWSKLHDTAQLMGYHCPTTFRVAFNHSLPYPEPYTPRTGQLCPFADTYDQCNNSATQLSWTNSGAEWTLPTPNGPDIPAGSLNNQGHLTKVIGQERLWWWGEDGDCQRVDGSFGMIFGPSLTESSRPPVLIDSIYRKLTVEFDSRVEFRGIEAMRFVISKSDIEMGPNSRCYHQQYRGIFNLTPPLFAPMYISKPFFRDVDPHQKILAEFGGDQPFDRELLNFTIQGVHIRDIPRNKLDYETYMDVLQHTGTTLQANARFQVNTWLRPIHVDDCPWMFPLTHDDGAPGVEQPFPYTMLPILYCDRHIEMSDALIDRIRREVLIPLQIFKIVGYAGGVLAVAFFIVGLGWGVHKFKTRHCDTAPLSPISPIHEGGTVVIMPSGGRRSTRGNSNAVNNRRSTGESDPFLSASS